MSSYEESLRPHIAPAAVRPRPRELRADAHTMLRLPNDTAAEGRRSQRQHPALFQSPPTSLRQLRQQHPAAIVQQPPAPRCIIPAEGPLSLPMGQLCLHCQQRQLLPSQHLRRKNRFNGHSHSQPSSRILPSTLCTPGTAGAKKFPPPVYFHTLP